LSETTRHRQALNNGYNHLSSRSEGWLRSNCVTGDIAMVNFSSSNQRVCGLFA
jgi:hypothetical protein